MLKARIENVAVKVSGLEKHDCVPQCSDWSGGGWAWVGEEVENKAKLSSIEIEIASLS